MKFQRRNGEAERNKELLMGVEKLNDAAAAPDEIIFREIPR